MPLCAGVPVFLFLDTVINPPPAPQPNPNPNPAPVPNPTSAPVAPGKPQG